MDHIKTTIGSLAALAFVLFMYSLAATEYTCQPYEPREDCDLGRFEVRIHDITERGKRLIAVAQGACVYTMGHGKSKRYVMEDVEFTAANRTDYMDRIEFPVRQSVVCQVR